MDDFNPEEDCFEISNELFDFHDQFVFWAEGVMGATMALIGLLSG